MDRKEHWDKVYTNNSIDNVSWFQREPKVSAELIGASGVGKNSQIIDVGGGASILVDNLLKSGYKNICVNDISEIPLEITKTRLSQKAETVTWLVGDITKYNFNKKYDLWHDRAVFHFLTDENDRRNYINVLKNSLNPGGQIIIAAFAIDGPTKCSGLEIEQYNSEKIISVLGKEFNLLEEREEIHITPGGKEQKFAYFRINFD